MGLDYDPLLFLLSLLVAVQASFVGLRLALDISRSFAFHRRLLTTGAALSLATGIWGMHFIGMLAAHFPVNIDYAVLPTLLSFLVCVLVVGLAIILASLRSGLMLAGAAVVMGLGIATMHYIGMLAVHASLHLAHNPAAIAGSVVIAIAASFLALWLAFAAERRPPILGCALILGCAISGMHYTAMSGIVFHALDAPLALAAPSISRDWLAAIVSIVAFAVSGLFMLTLVPWDLRVPAEFRNGHAEYAPLPAVPQPPAPQPKPMVRAAPQGLSGSPLDPLPQETVPEPHPLESAGLGIIIKGEKQNIRFSEIVSVHANAHYTYVFNGREDFFCPLPIGEVARRLPGVQFFRVHRSSIVHVASVARLIKAGDNGLAELDCPMRRRVAVSRNRLAELRARVPAAARA